MYRNQKRGLNFILFLFISFQCYSNLSYQINVNEKGISQIDIKIDSFYECNSINGLLLYLPFLAKKINSNSSHLITLKQNEESTIILISFTEPFVNSVIISCEADLKIQSEKTN